MCLICGWVNLFIKLLVYFWNGSISMTTYLIIIKHKEIDEKCYLIQLSGYVMLISLAVSLM